jgi:hypothetical protein
MSIYVTSLIACHLFPLKYVRCLTQNSNLLFSTVQYRCPDLFVGGVHGDNPEDVFREIRELANWVIETHRKDGKPLPPPSTHLQLV